jgi:hypothetical protein
MRDPYDPYADEHAITADQAWATEQNRRRHADRLHAIANCPLCDTDGYRDTHVCDHTDHRAAARRGMAQIRAALNRDETRDETPPPGTTTPNTPHSQLSVDARPQKTRL